MKYPEYLNKKDLIGLTALSKGCSECIDELESSVTNLSKYFNVAYTSNVLGGELVSSSKENRILELNQLLKKNIKLLSIVRGGDFLYETLDSIPYKKIVNKNLWVQGYSDPTSLLYILTTKYDLATIYGYNGKGFEGELDKSKLNNIKILKGQLTKQTSFDRDNISIKGDFKSEGILIGGCIECLKDLIGTKYDNTLNFINKYKNKNIVWYFDVYNMTPINLYLTLLQFKNAGWFKYSNTFLIGKMLFNNDSKEFSYLDAYKALDGNVVYDCNFGHTYPKFTLINGSYAEIKYKNRKLEIKQTKLGE